MHVEGNCLCGGVTYAFDGEPVVTGLRHCTDCQRQTGTSSSIVVGVPATQLQVLGDSLRSFATTGTDHGTARTATSAPRAARRS